jgi:hypothetical protein
LRALNCFISQIQVARYQVPSDKAVKRDRQSAAARLSARRLSPLGLSPASLEDDVIVASLPQLIDS